MSAIDAYVFLAGAVAERKIALREAGPGDRLAYSDGLSIYLPPALLNSPEDVWRAVVAQALLLRAGSLQGRVLRQLVGRRATTRRYLYLEIVRAGRLSAQRLPSAFLQGAEWEDAPVSGSAEDSLDLASSSLPLPATPNYFGTIRPLTGLRRIMTEHGFGRASEKNDASNIASVEIPELDSDDEGESSMLLRLFQNPFSSSNPLADLLKGILGAGVSKDSHKVGSGDDSSAEMPVGRVETALRRGVHSVLTKLVLQSRETHPAIASAAILYPEWDAHTHSYRRDWVSVEEVEPERSSPKSTFSRPLVPAPRELRRQLSGLGLEQEIHSRQNDGSDLDLGALIDCAIDLRAGYSPPALQVYRASRRTLRDLAVTVVLDISGSTGERNSDGSAVFRKQVQFAYQLGFALDSLGDTLAMFGFHSWGRKLVRVVRIKGPEERWGSQVAERLAVLEPIGYTRIGTAIRHGSRVLRESMRLPNRLLVLITDGIAYDQDYELGYAAADARKALEEARAGGIACICVSVGSGTETEKLAEVFGGANILAVDEVEELTGRIRGLCRHALATVARRRWIRQSGASPPGRSGARAG